MVKRRILSDDQLRAAREWQAVGYSWAEARYKVLTPTQQEAFYQQTKAAARRRHAADPRKQLLRAKRNGATFKGIEFTITVDDLDWPTHCPVTGVELHYGGQGGNDDRGRGVKGARPNSASIDRIDNARGYVSGNVVIVSYWVNTRKGDATPDQLRAIADYYGAA